MSLSVGDAINGWHDAGQHQSFLKASAEPDDMELFRTMGIMGSGAI
jgi:hypothetical protein